MKIKKKLFCFLALTINNISYAGDVDFGDKKPSADEIINIFNSDNIQKENKLRSIGPLMQSTTIQNVDAKSSKRNNSNSLSLRVIFHSNSAELTEKAKDQLEPIGKALASQKLQNIGFVIEGHTDTKGSATYNKILSENRANSVKKFFTDNFDIKSSRIRVIGKGEENLLDYKNPHSEVNRRVRIIAIK